LSTATFSPSCQGLHIQDLSENDLSGKVASLLAIAYETRDLRIAELFALERRLRRDTLTLELQKLSLVEARAKLSLDYTELDNVKLVLTNRGFADEVCKYTKCRDAPIGCRVPPSDFVYVYNPSGTFVQFLNIPCRMLTSRTEIQRVQSCANQLKNDGVSVNNIAIPV
jgi:hypothetical protein